MMDYLLIKTVHIISATILFGTGLGTAFFLFRTWIAGDAGALRVVSRQVVLADWMFTLPAVIVQPLTGLWLMARLGYSFTSPWFLWVITLYSIAGACWIPVVHMQIRLRELADKQPKEPSREFNRLMYRWIVLGIVAFSCVVILFGLMVFKPGLS